MGTEAAGLLTRIVWVYAGVAVVVSQLGEGKAVSILAVTAIVVLAHALARLLPRMDIGLQALRVSGALISLAVIYLVLRLEITGDVYLWELGWLGDFVSDSGATLEGQSGTAAEVVLLAMAWIFGVAQGSRPRTFEGLAGEVSIGLVAVLFAALFANAADAPAIVSWLPIPYLAVAMVALAAVHFSAVGIDRGRPFAGMWWLGVVGSLVVIGAIALPTALIDLEALSFIGDGIGLAAKGIGLALAFTLLPPLVGLAWTLEQLFNLLFIDAEPFTPDIPTTDQLTEELEKERGDTPPWTKVIGYILRFGLVGVAVALVVALLYLAFQRITKSDEDEVELREDVDAGGGGGLGSLLGDAFSRLRGRFAGGVQGYDAIGRLYFGMLRSAEAQGLLRPAAATPREFAPRLVSHYESELPTAISDAYAAARYGGREAREDEVAQLSTEWTNLNEQRERDKPA